MVVGFVVLGLYMYVVYKLFDEFEVVGFEDIKKFKYKVFIGMWFKDKRLWFCGLFLRMVMMDGLRGVS